MLEQFCLFESGSDGYHTYRIPALAVSARGTILAFCEKGNQLKCSENH